MPVRATNTIDVNEALRLYHVWRNWREVANHLIRPNGQRYQTHSIFNAVRRHDLQATE